MPGTEPYDDSHRPKDPPPSVQDMFRSVFSECDSWHKWNAMEEPEENSDVTLYCTRPAGSAPERAAGDVMDAELKEFEEQVGVEFDRKNLLVKFAGAEARNAGVLAATGPVDGNEMMLTKVCGGDVHCVEDILRIWRTVGRGGNFTVTFEQCYTKKICTHDVKMHRYNFEEPFYASYHGREDAAAAAVLGFTVSSGLKINSVMAEYGKGRLREGEIDEAHDETAAHKAGLKVGMVVREVNNERVTNLKEFRKAITKIYQKRCHEEGLSTLEQPEGERRVPDVTIEMTVTAAAETAGERTARVFHHACGEDNWKGASTVFIDCYEQIQEACPLILSLIGEDEDKMMDDFKRFVTIFFANKDDSYKRENEQVSRDDGAASSRPQVMFSEANHSKSRAPSEAGGMSNRKASMRGFASGSQVFSQKASGASRAASTFEGLEEKPSAYVQGVTQEGASMGQAMQGFAGAKGGGSIINIDAYGNGVLLFLKARIAEEECQCAIARAQLFYLCILQLVFGLVVFGLGAEDVPSAGGKIAPFIATTVAASTGIISSLFGFLGAIGGGSDIRKDDELKKGADVPNLGEPNEKFLQTFLALNLWLMSVLTTFLYTTIIELDESHSQCNAANIGNTPGANTDCLHQTKRQTALVVMCGLMLGVVLLSNLRVSDLLDSINDKTKIEQKNLTMTYFRVRLVEARDFMKEHLREYVRTNFFALVDNEYIEGDTDNAVQESLTDTVTKSPAACPDYPFGV